jgi:hypothetical protein
MADNISDAGTEGNVVDDDREILVSDDTRAGLPQNRYGNRVFTSANGPNLDDFQRDTLDVIREERAQGLWRPNPLDLQPGVDPSILDNVKGIDDSPNEDLDKQPPRKNTGKSWAERGHHPEWTDARRNQQAGFWGPYTPSVAASRDTVPNAADIYLSDDDWSEGSEYDGGHPWDTHHDQGWARPRLAPLPKTQWRQRAERDEMENRPNRAPEAYWDPDKWDPEYKRRGSWVLPEGQQLKDTKGFEMKMLPLGLPQSEINKYVKPLSRENLLLWIDHLDSLDPAKKTGKSIEWTKQNADRRTLSWMDQFNPPDNTDIEWMNKYDEDTRHQWEDVQTIHPKDWKTRHQAGNTLPPQHDANFAGWKAKFSGNDDPDPDSSLPESENNRRQPLPRQPAPEDPSGFTSRKDDGNGGDDPGEDPNPSNGGSSNIPGGQKVALIAGGVAAGAALLGGLGLLAGWGWRKIARARKEKELIKEKEYDPGSAEAISENGIRPPASKVRRTHPREWKRRID